MDVFQRTQANIFNAYIDSVFQLSKTDWNPLSMSRNGYDRESSTFQV